jgi:hypothetical protein
VGDTVQYIQKQVEAGKVDLDKTWCIGTDKTHPDDAGYQLYFEAVRDGYEQAIAQGTVCVLPDKPVFGDSYMNPQRHILVDMPTYPKGWQRQKTYRKDIEPLTFEFEGTFVGIFGEMNGDSVPFRVYVDGQLIESGGSEFWEKSTARFSSSGSGNLFSWTVLAKDLTPGKHTLKIDPLFLASDKEGSLHIESICTAGPRK